MLSGLPAICAGAVATAASSACRAKVGDGYDPIWTTSAPTVEGASAIGDGAGVASCCATLDGGAAIAVGGLLAAISATANGATVAAGALGWVTLASLPAVALGAPAGFALGPAGAGADTSGPGGSGIGWATSPLLTTRGVTTM